MNVASDDYEPKYMRIYRHLLGQITSGELEPGSRLPSQQALADQFGVTLMTLRQALGALGDEGMVVAARGKGTFVAQRPFQYRLNHLSSFAQEMERQGVSLTTRVVSASLTALDTQVGLRLGLRSEEKVFAIERVRLVDGTPVLHQRSYLPPEYVTQIDSDSLEGRSLYDVLLEDVGIEIVRAVETLRPVVLSDYEAELLLRSPRAPALVSERLSLGDRDVPVLLDYAVMPGDAAVITTERVSDRLSLRYRVL